MSHLTTSINVAPPIGMMMGDVRPIDSAPSVCIAHFFGSKGALDPGWYLVNRIYEQFGLPFAGPFLTSAEALKAWVRHRDYMRNSLNSEDHLLYQGTNSIVYKPFVVLNAYAVSLGNFTRVDSFVKIEGGQGVIIGDHVHIASFCHIGIGGGVTILEEGSSVGSGGRILSGSNEPDAVSCSATARPEDQRQTKAVTRICKNATIYAGATVMPGVTVGEGARIAAGAVVLHDVEPFSLYAGVPARCKKTDWRVK